MIISLSHKKKTYTLDTSRFVDLSIPYNFNGDQPNFYDVKPGRLTPFKSEGITYSVKDGAGCNVLEISMNIHCTGTHTECIGHIIDQNSSISKYIQDLFFPAILLTVKPVPFSSCHDSYHVNIEDSEKVISRGSLEKAFQQFKDRHPSSIIIRTLPNPPEKQFFNYTKQIPPFFTHDSIKFLYSQKVQHLVIDLPSLDRMEDDGILENHRIFWGGGENIDNSINPNSTKTITELAYIPDDVDDGFYFLNIQIPHFQCDAAPSRPILIKPV